jgi:glyoxylase-like metal-dependent hydrolase (beta-lactamase superfamily II)
MSKSKSDEKTDITIESIVVGPIQTNVYVVGCAQTGRAAIVDAGGNAPGLLELAAKHDLEIVSILQTHAHIDHLAAIPEIKRATGAPIYLHPDDRMLWQAAPQQGMRFGIEVEELPDFEHELSDGQRIEIGELQAEVMWLPGHSPGSVAFHFAAQSVVLSGDVLFAGSMGRVDLPGSNPDAMRASLARIKQLPDETRVLSGHGPATSIGREKQLNPFLRQDW